MYNHKVQLKPKANSWLHTYIHFPTLTKGLGHWGSRPSKAPRCDSFSSPQTPAPWAGSWDFPRPGEIPSHFSGSVSDTTGWKPTQSTSQGRHAWGNLIRCSTTFQCKRAARLCSKRAHSHSMPLISPRMKGNKDLAGSGLMTTDLINTKIHSNTP